MRVTITANYLAVWEFIHLHSGQEKNPAKKKLVFQTPRVPQQADQLASRVPSDTNYLISIAVPL